MSGEEPEQPTVGMDVDAQSEASDMEEVVDMEMLKEMEEQGMVKIENEEEGPPPGDDDDEEMGDGGEGEPEGEEVPDVPDLAVAVLQKHTKGVHAVAIHPTLPLVASGGEDDKAYLWKVDPTKPGPASVAPFAELNGHTDTVLAVAFSADGSILATGGMDGRVMLWTPEGALLHTMEDLGDSVTYMFWHPRGKVLFAGSSDSQSVMWNEKGVVLQVFAGHAAEVTCGALVSDNKLLATGSEDQSVRVFSPKTSEMVAVFDSRAKGMHNLPLCTVTAISAHPKNPDVVVTGWENGYVSVMSITGKKVLLIAPQHQAAVEAVVMSPILPYFATCSAGDGTLALWNGEDNSIREKLKQEAGFVSLTWSGEHLYSIDTQGEVHRYQGRAITTSTKTWTGHTNTALSIAVHPDGWVVTGSDDTSVRMFSP